MDRKLNPPSTFQRGRDAETRACAALEARGLKLIESNFRFRRGEVDLVMAAPGGTVVFVEVRSSGAQASPWLRQTITARKRARLERTALTYFHRRPWLRGRPFRFDLVWIEAGHIEHWPNVALR